MTTNTITRPTEPICPPWCAGHDDRYQAWERYDDGLKRSHDDTGRAVADVAVYVGRMESARGLEPGTVSVYVDGPPGFDAAALSPAQARELAALLIESAERIEAHQ